MEKNHRYSKKQKYLLRIKIYKESKTKYKDNHSLETNNYITNKNKKIFISNNRQLYTKYIVKSLNEEKRGNKISELIKIFIKKKLIIFILILTLINGISSKINYHQSVIFNSSEIILKINEIGMNTILSKRNLNISYLCPSQIILNNVIQNLSDCSQININEPGSIVKLVWDTPLHSVNSLFEYCYNITEIKFLNFDTSLLTDMSWVFQFCYSLTSVDLSNLNISNVSAIRFMFNNCISLKSLNLSNFDTSNTTYMNRMFQNCSQLTSIDLSNFDTSKVEYMNNLFYNCKNLEYINLLNFTDNKNPTKQEMLLELQRMQLYALIKIKLLFYMT